MPTGLPLALVLLSIAFAVGGIDELYFHLVKYRLHTRERSAREHFAHTLRAVMLPMTLVLAFVATRSPQALMAFVALQIVDHAIAFWDASMEHDSRADLGGLTRAEYLTHIVATTFHSAGIAVLLVSGWTSGLRAPAVISTIGALMAIGASAVALLHVVLAVRQWLPTRVRRRSARV